MGPSAIMAVNKSPQPPATDWPLKLIAIWRYENLVPCRNKVRAR